jgi:hypothetical protein
LPAQFWAAGHQADALELSMSPRLRLMTNVLIPAALLPLAACGPGRNQFAPVCPTAQLVPTLADITRYDKPGTAHDLTDLVVQARVVAIDGKCSAGDEPNDLPATVKVGIVVQRGPAMKGRDADIPVFLAVTEGADVIAKQIMPVHVTFPPNVDRLSMTSPDISINLPVTPQKSGAAFGIIAGFQLTPDELAANRQDHGG